MKLNLWVIADSLRDFNAVARIEGASADIEGMRVASGGETTLESRYVYLCSEPDGVRLKNGEDELFLPGADAGAVMNALLAAFEAFNAFQARLDALSAERDLAALLNLGGERLENPLMLSDASGNVLAMSARFHAEDINPYWVTARDTGHIPLEVLSAPMFDEQNRLHSWNDAPTLFHTQDGDRLIGSYISVGGKRAAGLGLWEHARPIRPGDMLVFTALCGAIASALQEKTAENTGRAVTDIFRDILDGKKIESGLLSRIEIACKTPWRLVLIANPFRADSIYKQSLLRRLERYPRPNISFLYENHVLVLIADKDAEALADSISSENGKLYYQIVLSLPFDALADLPARYQQCVYAMQQTREQPGVYRGEDYALSFLVSRFARLNQEQNLAHPALAALRRHDMEKNTEYYKTLFVYLLHERSILLGAAELHIHKNSFLYRIQKIREMIDADLDNPHHRAYLLLSYYMEQAQSPR